MQIQGLQKLTLLDYPEKMAATVFLGGCDMRCPYCHNAEILDATKAGILSQEELFAFLQERKGFLDGVCVTGGEPLLHPEIGEFLGKIQQLGFLVKLDTNGSHPDRLEEVLDQGLVDYVAMDVKNAPDRYQETTGVRVDLKKIDRSIRLLMEKAPDYEFRTTVTKTFHDKNSFLALAEWISGANAYYLQAYQVSDHVPDKSLGTPSKEDLEVYAAIMKKTVQKVQIRAID